MPQYAALAAMARRRIDLTTEAREVLHRGHRAVEAVEAVEAVGRPVPADYVLSRG